MPSFDLRKFQQLSADLPSLMESEHFVVHYGLRNPRQGRGLGAGGVGDPVLVRWYLSALEQLYRTLTKPPWNRQEPRTDPSIKRTRVFVCDLDQVGIGVPFAAADRQQIPFIALPCRSDDPLIDSALRRAAANAIHEATHVFNARERPFHRLDSQWWVWLNEAIATFMESRVLPGNQDYFRFLADWVNEPGVSLNDSSKAYQGCLFLHYLTGRLGPDLLNRVWVDSTVEEKPLEAFRRLLPPELPLASAAPDREDLFASGFAMDAYFLRDHGCGCFAPEISNRFGDRAVAASFELKRGESCQDVGELPHLATHYYRIFPHRNVNRIRLAVIPQAGAEPCLLKAEAAVTRSDSTRGARQILRPGERSHERESLRLEGEIHDLQKEDLHHLVVVVSNCTLKDLPIAPAWDDPPEVARYAIEVAAL